MRKNGKGGGNVGDRGVATCMYETHVHTEKS